MTEIEQLEQLDIEFNEFLIFLFDTLEITNDIILFTQTLV